MHGFVLDAVARLENIAFAVSIAVILLLALTFAGLFFLYYRSYGRCISNKLEDDALKKEIIKENRKYFAAFSRSLSSENGVFVPFSRYREENRKARNRMKIVGNTVLIVFYSLFLFALGSAIYARSQGELIALGDTTCVIIRSASMEEKNARNTYLDDFGLDDQISPYALIGLKKAEKEEIALYDIVAVRDDDNRLVVHRVVAIEEKDGQRLYTLRGDANAASADYERNLTYEEIVGRYNGFQSFALGVIVYYFQSGIGFITLCFALILLGLYDALDIFLGKKIQMRKEALYPSIDAELESVFRKRRTPLLTDESADSDPFVSDRIRVSRLGKIEFRVPPKEKAPKRKKGLRTGKIEARVPTYAEQKRKKKRKRKNQA